MGKDKVYIILVNFNGWYHTIECLESLLKSNYANYQIVVVDNNSSDYSIENIQAWADGKLSLWLRNASPLGRKVLPSVERKLAYIFYRQSEAEAGGSKMLEQEAKQTASSNNAFRNQPPIILIQTGENLGFAGGNNVGMCYALSKGDGEYVWLLNNDTVVREDTLTNLISKMTESRRTGAVGSVLMSYSTPNTVRTLGGGVLYKYLGFTNNICRNHLYDQQFIAQTPPATRIDFISGCSTLVTNELIRRIGLLDHGYFAYWEDADWSERIKRKGYSLNYATKSIVYHKEGQSSSLYKAAYFSTFNCFRFYRKYYRHALPLAFLNRLFFIFVIAVKNRNLSYLKGSLYAYHDFLKTLL